METTKGNRKQTRGKDLVIMIMIGLVVALFLAGRPGSATGQWNLNRTIGWGK